MTSTLKTNAIEPEGATTNLVIGESGQNTVISNNDIRANVLQDAGGNAVFTSNGSGVLSGVNSAFGSAMVLLSTQTASDSASLSFTSGIDSTYKEYIFRFYNIHPETDIAEFNVTFSTDGGSNYGVTKTCTWFYANHYDNDSGTGVQYTTSLDLAQSTDAQTLNYDLSSDAGHNAAGELHLFNPSSTTYVKHYFSRMNENPGDSGSREAFVGGYCNITSAINAVQFAMSSGNFAGKIKMWGVK